VVSPTQQRRARLRAATAEEIKTIALKHMAANGTGAIALRAIAREMGMTAGAIYSYYDTRDDLITALIAHVYGSLADTMEAARDSRPAWEPAERVLAVGEAYRTWAIEHPDEFRLVYGDPIPGYRAPASGPASDAEQRACAVLLGLVAAAWPEAAAASTACAEEYRWTDFKPGFVALAREAYPDLPPTAVAISLRVWGRMHGLVALEVYGHLRTEVEDPAKLYRAEMADLARTLGLNPRPTTPN
jgi:AcrR family transcriptional regulator